MKRLIRTTSLLTTAFAFALLLPAAQGNGCSNDDVIIGDDGDDGGGDEGGGTAGGDPGVTCYVGGCSGQLCSDIPDQASTCEWTGRRTCTRGPRRWASRSTYLATSHARRFP